MCQSPHHGRRSGFTLLEVVVALGLLSCALLAVAPLLTVAARATDVSRATTVAANLAAQKLEQLRALAWGFDADGVPVEELGPSPPGSLTANTSGYVDYLDDGGAWIGGGPSPPPQAVFVRRWSIETDGGAVPAATLILWVVILRRGAPSAATPGGERPWTEMARIVSARARRAG
jgi:prepilin-type N-terminal cleavage/methylation domain-containing protein